MRRAARGSIQSCPTAPPTPRVPGHIGCSRSCSRLVAAMRHACLRVTNLPTPTKSTLSASDDAWRQAPASCQSLDQQACATARSWSSRCTALSYLLLLVPKCVPWPTPVHKHRAAVGAARALLQVFRSLAAVCSPSIVAFDFGFSDRSFSATLCEKDNPERKPPSRK